MPSWPSDCCTSNIVILAGLSSDVSKVVRLTIEINTHARTSVLFYESGE